MSRPDDAFESPVRHAQALKETEQHLVEGKEQVKDWEVAKRELRRCFE